MKTHFKNGPLVNVKNGMKLTRKYQSTKDVWSWDATVTNVTKDSIICMMNIDRPRTARYNRKTGVDLNPKFGWLEY